MASGTEARGGHGVSVSTLKDAFPGRGAGAVKVMFPELAAWVSFAEGARRWNREMGPAAAAVRRGGGAKSGAELPFPEACALDVESVSLRNDLWQGALGGRQ